MLDNYVLLDLETTGATPLKDRITEIALIRYQDGVELDRWQTLVNPQSNIPEFIQKLTGISNEMVADAPSFERVAGELLDYLDGSILCAHNVRFDYGFLKAEFKRIGINFKSRVLCTVKLSRKLYPEFPSHSLSALIQRYGFTCTERHRAMGDVQVMAQFLEYVKRDQGDEKIHQAVAALTKQSSIPSGLDNEQLQDIPETPGVYLFYGENNLPIYIGKSINLRSRVLSHFSSDHRSTKEMRISQEIKHIDWIETCGEFGALLLESQLVKQKQPIYNRQLRRERQLCAWKITPSNKSIAQLSLVGESEITTENLDCIYGTFKTKKQAIEVLRNLAEQNALCLKALGLEFGTGPCFGYQIKRCKGVCCAKEAPEIHLLRLQQALISLRMRRWGFAGKIAIKETHPYSHETQLHIFDQWCHLATVSDEQALQSVMAEKHPLSFDLDTYKLLLKELSKPKLQIIHL
jgi:DNA polymerase-3 subunit epsilon